MNNKIFTLKNTTILITRPQHQAQQLTAMIEAAGGRAILCPTIAIAPAENQNALQQTLSSLEHYDIVIFVSANAVDQCKKLLRQYWPALKHPPQLATVGPATADALTDIGLPAPLYPPFQFNSEALLALPALQSVANKQILIVAGAEGRDLIATTLAQRGAQVATVIAYRRVLPDIPIPTAIPDIIVCTSITGLENLYKMYEKIPNKLAHLLKTPLLVISQRMLLRANELGFALKPIVAIDATDAAIYAGLISWRNSYD